MTELQFCTNSVGIAIQPTPENGYRSIVRVRCKRWTCEYCAAKNRAIWRAILIHHINQTGGTWAWFTLTAHRYARGEQRSLLNLRGAWDSIIKRMKRKFGNFSYARVYEKHQDSSYHIHAIASINFDDIRIRISRKTKKQTSYSAWLQKTAWELGIGMYTHASNVADYLNNAGYVSSYITKYIVKLDTATKSEYGRVRHIQTSQNWIRKPEYSEGSNWAFKVALYYEDVQSVVGQYAYVDISAMHIVTIDDYDNNYAYPPDPNFSL